MDKREIISLPAENDNRQYFFGYYDKCPWNLSQKYILAHSIGFQDRMPTANDAITIGLIDVSENSNREFQPITKTFAWSWQQGAMLQWYSGDPENSIVYNARRDGKFIGIVRNIHTGQERILDKPVAAVSRDGAYGLSLNFSRLADLRPGYGYEGLPDTFAAEDASNKDGIYLIDMYTGDAKFIISVAQIKAVGNIPEMNDTRHWFNHLMFSPNGKRFIFLHRWQKKGTNQRTTRMFTANIDGSEIYCLNDNEMTSHFDWKDDKTIIAWARRHDIGDRYFLFKDREQKVEIIGDKKLTPYGDGHCTYLTGGPWILTDSYPDQENKRHLMLYNPSDDNFVKLGSFYSQPWPIPARCDLHIRWNRDGTQVCFDSSHEGKRRIYIMDIDLR